MIVSPWNHFFVTLLAGFFFNLPVMTTLVLVWEKYNIDTMSYSASFVPIIVLMSILIGIVCISMFALVNELLDKGCLTWHRDALGQFFQILVCLICILTSAVNVRVYLEEYEQHPRNTIRDRSMLSCFQPLLILTILVGLKLVLFKVKHSLAITAIILSLASMTFAFESHFDNDKFEAPLFVVAIPVAFILLTFTF